MNISTTNIIITIIGFTIIFLGNLLGAGLIFFFKKDINEKLNTIFLGFASGIMVAASIFSLILPSLESETLSNYGDFKFVPSVVGFLLGGLFLFLIDKIIPHFHKGTNEEEGVKSKFSKSTNIQDTARIISAKQLYNIQTPILNTQKKKELNTLSANYIQEILINNKDIKYSLDKFSEDWQKL